MPNKAPCFFWVQLRETWPLGEMEDYIRTFEGIFWFFCILQAAVYLCGFMDSLGVTHHYVASPAIQGSGDI